MLDQTPFYRLSEIELIILCAYFLALPLPPLISRELAIDETDGQRVLEKATQSLIEKGFIRFDEDSPAGMQVDTDLAEHLRVMAYGNEMVHIYLHHKGKDSRQIAFYHNHGCYIQQELLGKAEHIVQPVNDLGISLVKDALEAAGDGVRGVNTEVPLQAWHLLLTSRELGSEAAVLSELTTAAQGSDKEGVEARMALISDVLDADTILELTSIIDRLNLKQEQAAFVLSNGSNWLGMISRDEQGEEGKLYALQVPRQNLLWAAESIFASIRSTMDSRGRSA